MHSADVYRPFILFELIGTMMAMACITYHLDLVGILLIFIDLDRFKTLQQNMI